MKNNKGITLIALVITIIVLLILAGITIAMLTGDNGLLTRSQNSANDNLHDKIELNTKFYPSKANIYKNEYENKHHSPRTSNSPIVNYYAGMGHPNQNNDSSKYIPPLRNIFFCDSKY